MQLNAEILIKQFHQYNYTRLSLICHQIFSANLTGKHSVGCTVKNHELGTEKRNNSDSSAVWRSRSVFGRLRAPAPDLGVKVAFRFFIQYASKQALRIDNLV